MRKCLDIDFKNRPTFEQVVPILESYLSNVHKQVNNNNMNNSSFNYLDFFFNYTLVLWIFKRSIQ